MPLMADEADWSYSGNPMTSDLDQVRFWLQDTDPQVRLLSNSELGFLILQWFPKYDSLVYVASIAAESVSTKFAGVVTVSADGVSVNVADLSDRYAKRAMTLRKIHKDLQVGGEIDLTNIMVNQRRDDTIAPLNFSVGLHDNPMAGNQAFGDRVNPWDDAADRAHG